LSLETLPGGPVDEVVEELAKKYNRTPAQILLKWNLIKGLILILFYIDFLIYIFI
jgi:diketogulonate reductase-like aldo/keto reductase